MRTKPIALLIVGVPLVAGGFLGNGAESALLSAHRRPPFPKTQEIAGVKRRGWLAVGRGAFSAHDGVGIDHRAGAAAAIDGG
jgi:hypothetical protein